MGQHADAYRKTVEAFNADGNLEPWLALLDEHAVGHGPDGTDVVGKAAIREAFEANRAETGWDRNELLTLDEADGWLVAIIRNYFNGQPTPAVSGAARLDADGRWLEYWLHAAPA